MTAWLPRPCRRSCWSAGVAVAAPPGPHSRPAITPSEAWLAAEKHARRTVVGRLDDAVVGALYVAFVVGPAIHVATRGPLIGAAPTIAGTRVPRGHRRGRARPGHVRPALSGERRWCVGARRTSRRRALAWLATAWLVALIALLLVCAAAAGTDGRSLSYSRAAGQVSTISPFPGWYYGRAIAASDASCWPSDAWASSARRPTRRRGRHGSGRRPRAAADVGSPASSRACSWSWRGRSPVACSSRPTPFAASSRGGLTPSDRGPSGTVAVVAALTAVAIAVVAPVVAVRGSLARGAPRSRPRSALAADAGRGMTAQLEVDLTSGVPAFEQIRAQVVAHVAAGRLVAGDRLPTIRALATDLGLAAGTVARAFRELEAEGVVETRRRAGTVIAEGASVPDRPRAACRRDLRVGRARRRADRRRGARAGARCAARASERDAHQHRLGLELDAERTTGRRRAPDGRARAGPRPSLPRGWSARACAWSTGSAGPGAPKPREKPDRSMSQAALVLTRPSSAGKRGASSRQRGRRGGGVSNGLVKNEPALHVSWSARRAPCPCAARRAEHGVADVGQRCALRRPRRRACGRARRRRPGGTASPGRSWNVTSSTT